MKIGLRGKFLFPALILILVGTVSTAALSHFNSQKMMTKSIVGQLKQNAGSTLDYIVSWVENREQDVILWSQQSSISQGVFFSGESSDHGSAFMVKEINDNLKTYKKAHPYYEEIGVARKTGDILTTSNLDVKSELVTNKNIKKTDYFQKSMEGEIVISNVRRSELSGKPVFIISSPVKYTLDGSNDVIGVFYAVVDLLYFTKKFVEPIEIGKKGYVYIFDKDGMVISHPDSSRIMGFNIKNDTGFGSEAIEKGKGVIEYTVEGNEMMVSFKKDKSLGWTVAAVASVDEMLAPVRKLAGFNIMMTLVTLVVAAIVIFFVAATLTRPINKITGSLNSAALQVSNASKQISDSSHQLAKGATEQASSIEETSASLEELTSMANHNADNAQQASNISNETRDAASNGAESMEKLVNTMERINTSSEEVAKVAKGIEEIAFQTNLLALNAAVEAARAGEAGRGFAVVAEEVRSLAQKAAEHAKTTSTLMTESRNRTNEGSKQASETNEVLKTILSSVEKVVGLVSEITAASREQAQGIEQINKAVSTMDKIVQQNSANSEESASASQQLSAQAFQMKNLVNKLDMLVTGSSEGLEGTEEDSRSKRRVLKGVEDITDIKGKVKEALPSPDRKPVGEKPEEIIPFDEDEMTDF